MAAPLASKAVRGSVRPFSGVFRRPDGHRLAPGGPLRHIKRINGKGEVMQADNRLLDDLARVASGAFGALTGVRGEVEDVFRRRLERILADMDLVPRDELDRKSTRLNSSH